MKNKNLFVFVIIGILICLSLGGCSGLTNQGMTIEYVDEPIIMEADDLSNDTFNISYNLKNINFDEIKSIVLQYDLSSDRYDVAMKKIILKIDASDLQGVKDGKLNIIIDENEKLKANLDLGDLKSFGYVELPYAHRCTTYKMLQDGSEISFNKNFNMLQMDYTRTIDLSYSNKKKRSVDINDTEKLVLFVTKKANN